MTSEAMLRESKILILDDTAANVTLLRKMLSIKGFSQVESLTNPRQALDVCRLYQPDILLLDLRMPYLDGFQILDQLKNEERTRDIPVIIITADNDRSNILRALEAGAMDYVKKPFEPAEVLMRIRNILSHRLLARKVLEQNAVLERKVAQRTKELEDIQEELFERLLRAAEFRDNETGQHVSRIGHYVYRMALLMGLPEEEAKEYLYASMMHDIGKIAIPDDILLKPGKLSETEFEVMKQHTIKGASILTSSHRRILQLAERIAISHHERWDGAGYPFGLSGEDIPLGGRITAVFDVYDALTSERPYKKPWTEEEALREIERLSGTAFDPNIVEMFLENLAQFKSITEGRREDAHEPQSAGHQRRGIVSSDRVSFMKTVLGS